MEHAEFVRTYRAIAHHAARHRALVAEARIEKLERDRLIVEAIDTELMLQAETAQAAGITPQTVSAVLASYHPGAVEDAENELQRLADLAERAWEAMTQ